MLLNIFCELMIPNLNIYLTWMLMGLIFINWRFFDIWRWFMIILYIFFLNKIFFRQTFTALWLVNIMIRILKIVSHLTCLLNILICLLNNLRKHSLSPSVFSSLSHLYLEHLFFINIVLKRFAFPPLLLEKL